MKSILFICMICITDVFILNARHINGFPLLDMKLSGNEPVIFVPGIVSDELINRDIAISPDGNEIFYSASTPGFNYPAIIQVKKENGNADIYLMDAGIIRELFSNNNISRDTFYVKTQGARIHSVLSRPVNTNSNILAIIIPGSGPTDLNGNQPKLRIIVFFSCQMH